MLSKLLRHQAPCTAQQRQQHQLSGLWQQLHYCSPCAQPNHIHADRLQAQHRCSRAASTLEKLNIQPLSLPAEARHVAESAVPAAAADLYIPPLEAWGQDSFLMSGCEPNSAPLRVAVLVSGGVDSSLALQLVTAAGHKPTAFYLQIWFQEDFRNFWDACPWEEDLSYAQQVCDALGVPLVVVPLTQQYWDRVVSHSVAEIKEGRTPNPDMLCNSRVKFGAFVEYLQQEHAGSFDRIASGHYAKIQRTPEQHHFQHSVQQQQQQQAASSSSSSSSHMQDTAAASQASLLERQASHAQASSSSSSSTAATTPNGGSSSSSSRCQLMMVPDAVKDQTYFLANLSPSQLSRCMFPLGSFTKPQVRALATAAGLATCGRKDSQGICFLGKVKFGEFVGEHLGEWPGPLVEEDSGQVVGVHDGYWFYTVGQRGGIKLPGGPWYVTRKDMSSNIVYVSRTYYEQERRRDAFVCGPFNWLGQSRPQLDQPLFVKVRHGPNMYECSLQLGSREEAVAVLEQGTQAAFKPLAARQVVQAAEVMSSSSSSGGSSNGGSSSTNGGGEGGSGEQLQYGVVFLSENDQGLAAGQYAVFYQDQQCLGSAQIVGGLARSATPGITDRL